jgi:hypothetical protein
LTLSACSSNTVGAKGYCGVVAQLTEEENRFTVATLKGPPDRGTSKRFLENESKFFTQMRPLAPAGIASDVGTLAEAVARTRDRARANNYDTTKFEEPTDQAVDDARTRFDAFNKGHCNDLPPGIEGSLVPGSTRS